jgi:hypothetical protein
MYSVFQVDMYFGSVKSCFTCWISHFQINVGVLIGSCHCPLVSSCGSVNCFPQYSTAAGETLCYYVTHLCQLTVVFAAPFREGKATGA